MYSNCSLHKTCLVNQVNQGWIQESLKEGCLTVSARVCEFFDHAPKQLETIGYICAHSFSGFKHHGNAAGVSTT